MLAFARWIVLLLLASATPPCVAKLGGRSHVATPHVDVVIFANPAYAVGVAAAINSSRFHSSSRLRIFVGFDGDPDVLLQYLACVGVDATDVYVRRPVELVDRADIPKAVVRKDNSRPGLDKSRLANAANYARFTITTSFPEVRAAWYIDSDALPVADLGGREFTEFVRSGRAIQPAIRSGTIERQFDRAVLPIYEQKYGRRFKLGAPSWNAGVWLADFAQWEKLRIAEEAVFWVTQANEFAAQGQGRLWKLNTQPIMYLLFHDSTRKPTQFLSHGWNCESVDYEITDEAPRGCRIIHWNGGDKPWVPTANGHALWRQYLPKFDVKECAALIYVPPPPPPPESPDAPAEEADGGGGGGEAPLEGGEAEAGAGEGVPAAPADEQQAEPEPEPEPAEGEPVEGGEGGPPEGEEGESPVEEGADGAGDAGQGGEWVEQPPDAAPAEPAADAPPDEPAAEAPADAAAPPDAPAEAPAEPEQQQEQEEGAPGEAPPAEAVIEEEQEPAAAEGEADAAQEPPPEDAGAAGDQEQQQQQQQQPDTTPPGDGDAPAAAAPPAPAGPLSWLFGK